MVSSLEIHLEATIYQSRESVRVASTQPTPDPNTVVQEADQIEMDEEMEDAVVEEEHNEMYSNNISAQLV